MDMCRAAARRPTAALPDDGRDEPGGAADTVASALDALSTDLALTLIAALPRDQAQCAERNCARPPGRLVEPGRHRRRAARYARRT
jgi:hypothetical protein